MNEVYIFGVGKIARQFLYENYNNIKVVGFLDNNQESKSFLKGVDVYTPSKMFLNELKKYKIIVCTVLYDEIKIQLEDYGLMEYTDFFPYYYNKKSVLIIGNCHTGIIKQMLEYNVEFNKQYAICNMLPICMIKETEKKMYKTLLPLVDLVIHQDIRDDNSIDYIFGETYVKKKIKLSCCYIKMINTYGMGKIYYPYFSNYNDRNKVWNGGEYGLFPCKDLFLDKLINKGYAYQEIKNIIDECNYAPEMQQMVDDIFLKYSIREKKCDVKIVDYIKKYYKQKLLFFDIAHPSNDVLCNIVEQILSLLNIKPNTIDNACFEELSKFALPVYPIVVRNLGLKFSQKYIGNEKRERLVPALMDLKEYIEEYRFWCYYLEETND